MWFLLHVIVLCEFTSIKKINIFISKKANTINDWNKFIYDIISNGHML